MSKSMLEYSKTVLKKVSFDTLLFCKELKKAIMTLLPEEVEELKVWLESYITDKPTKFSLFKSIIKEPL
mgnify:CR=1 FL=1